MLRRLIVALTLGAGGASPLPAQDAPKPLAKVPEGRYALALRINVMDRVAIVELASADGKPTAKLLSASPQMPGFEVGTPSVENGVLKLPIKIGSVTDLAFECRPDPKEPRRFLGTLSDPRNENVFRGLLEVTDLEKLTQKDRLVEFPPSATQKKLTELRAAEGKLRVKARQAKDDEERAKLLAEADEAAKANAVEVPKLQRQLVAAGEVFASAEAAQQLLNGAAKAKVGEADVAAWVKVLEADAALYGPKIVAQTKSAVVTALVRQEGYGKLALPYALEAAGDKSLTTKGRYAALKLLQRVQVQAGLPDDADATMKLVVALDAELDADYLKTVPPFKPTKYAGRTDKSANRVVVMELFTGAQCPPCVAADVGFDALITSYKPADAIFLQYHMHIPGPDPLTNADTVARMAYYSKLNKDDFGGTPSVAFNGKPAAGGGGGMANAEKKYDEFTKVLSKALEETTPVSVRGAIKRTGDELSVTVELTGTKDLEEDAVLRLVLVEDTVKYVGGNGLRFHHHVVRSLLGTAKGVKVADLKDGKYTTTQNLSGLRSDLTKYLDDFAEKGRAFPYPERPLDLKGLKVVALVQDDATGEVVQAAQFDAAD